MYLTRILEQTVLETSRTFPVVLLTGPRQVGKTTLLRHLAEGHPEGERGYATLDDPDIRDLARRDPRLFFQRFPPPVLIDEIQYAPDLLPHIKMRVDERREPGAFWLTGSQAFHLMRAVSESLAGRVGIIPMLGLSAAELEERESEPFLPEPGSLARRAQTIGATGAWDVRSVFARIHRGAMPALHVDPRPDWHRFYASYTATYLQRDIRDLAQVADETAFFNFLVVVAARTARPVVYEELARDAGVSAPTAKKWLSLLKTSGIVALVQPYSDNRLKRVVKMPLVHMLDTGLAAWLLKWETPEALERGAMSGQFFESHVFAEIGKSWLNAGREPPLFYYRDKDRREIDLLILHNGELMPVEIKKTATPGRDALKHFAALSPLARRSADAPAAPVIGPGALVCMAERMLPLDARNSVVPAWMI